ncbi:MAG: aminoacyl-tRNA hydrolase [Gammaproteobacteria bacterium]|nr:aminoacyl-tRNA hydrolase [Gammaproteobacteria bacterium]
MNGTPPSPPSPRRLGSVLPASLEKAIDERFIRASGPGGQHVNKTASAVQMRFDTRLAELPDPVTLKLLKLAGSRADTQGVITIFAQRYRSQERNREDARSRLAALIEKARFKPVRRIPTRTPNSAKRKRLEGKRQQAKTKTLRGKPSSDD